MKSMKKYNPESYVISKLPKNFQNQFCENNSFLCVFGYDLKFAITQRGL